MIQAPSIFSNAKPYLLGKQIEHDGPEKGHEADEHACFHQGLEFRCDGVHGSDGRCAIVAVGMVAE